MTKALSTPRIDHLLSKVFEESTEGILITDDSVSIVAVNEGFQELSGYSRDEVLGKNPSMLNSGFHDKAFFKAMWDALKNSGCWQGEVWNRRSNGQLFTKWLAINAIHDDETGQRFYLGVFRDITAIKQTEALLEHISHYDPLTGLPNRVLFLDRLRQAMVRVERNGLQLGLMFIDLDQFKRINDTLGHRLGDRFLVTVAERISKTVRESDTVARLGGDEFTVILPDIKSMQDVIVVARKLISIFREPFIIDGKEVYTSTSIGICLYPFDGGTVDDLIINADIAMYEAKKRGKNQYKFFSAKMQARAMERLELESELHRAIERNELELYFQPKVALDTMQITGVEALLRWNHPQRGMVHPGDFVPLAEESGYIAILGDWVIRTACMQGAQWYFEHKMPMKIWVNIAGKQFVRADLHKVIEKSLGDAKLPAELFGIEVTESTVMQDMAMSINTLAKLNEMGVEIAVDDFGTGYSSLAYLKKFPIHYLKIPYEFINKVVDEDEDQAITAAIIAMAKSLNLKVVAEGVETKEVLDFLREKECDEIQGFLVARPVSADDFLAMLHPSDSNTNPNLKPQIH